MTGDDRKVEEMLIRSDSSHSAFSLDTPIRSHVVCLFCEMTTCSSSSSTTAQQDWINVITLHGYLVMTPYTQQAFFTVQLNGNDEFWQNM